MATRSSNRRKDAGKSGYNYLENEFKLEASDLMPSFFSEELDFMDGDYDEEIPGYVNKSDEKCASDGDGDKNEADEDDDTDGDNDDNSGGDFNGDADDDSPNFRDKEKELKAAIKRNLSIESQNVIDMNNDEFDEIIEKLRKKGVAKGRGIELQKLKNITRGRNGINR